MTDRISAFQLTIPAGGSPGTIFFTDCELGDSNVTKIIVVFPPGCAALVGVRIEHGGSQVYPFVPGTWFIMDDFTLEVDPSEQSTSGQWHVAGYNQDQFPHTIRIYFFYNLADMSSSQSVSLPVSL